MDQNSVQRAAIIASRPGDESSVAAAVARHPHRFTGFFMVDPDAGDAVHRTRRALTELRLHTVCLFPAMHHVPLDDPRTTRIVEIAAAIPGAAVFVHCGLLSIGVRDRLALPNRFNPALGDPIALARLAQAFPGLPFLVPHFGAGRFADLLKTMERCANVYLDTSSSNSWIRAVPGLTLARVFESTLSAVGPARMLFGTDSSFFPRGWQRAVYLEQKTILQDLYLTAEDQALILGGNFDRLFPASTIAAHKER